MTEIEFKYLCVVCYICCKSFDINLLVFLLTRIYRFGSIISFTVFIKDFLSYYTMYHYASCKNILCSFIGLDVTNLVLYIKISIFDICCC